MLEWVNCPICGESDMEKTSKDGHDLIFCVNHGCESNGGGNRVALDEMESIVSRPHNEVHVLRFGHGTDRCYDILLDSLNYSCADYTVQWGYVEPSNDDRFTSKSFMPNRKPAYMFSFTDQIYADYFRQESNQLSVDREKFLTT